LFHKHLAVIIIIIGARSLVQQRETKNKQQKMIESVKEGEARKKQPGDVQNCYASLPGVHGRMSSNCIQMTAAL